MTACLCRFAAPAAGLLMAGLLTAISTAPVLAQTCVAPAPNLISWWRAENNAADTWGTNDGIAQSSVKYAKGYTGRAFSFNGSNVVTVPDAASLDIPNGGAVTIELWAYRTSSAFPQHLAGKRSGCGGGDGFYQIAIGSSAHPDSSVPLNQWVHMAQTIDTATGAVEAYVDGQVVASYAAPGWALENSAPLTIGNSGTCSGFGGLIDEVKLYNRALTQTEIQAIYTAGRAGQCLPQPAVTGSVSGIAPTSGQVVCQDLTTSKSVTITLPAVRNWSCEAAGLAINAGDKVQITEKLSGTAD